MKTALVDPPLAGNEKEVVLGYIAFQQHVFCANTKQLTEAGWPRIPSTYELLQGTDWDDVIKRANGDGNHFSYRWVALHLIEEWGRHLGHADLLRENIDGETGD